MISHHTSPGTIIFCQGCRHTVAVVHSINVDATPEYVNETVTFQDTTNGEIFTPKDHEFCQHCNTAWFYDGYFIDTPPDIVEPTIIQREYANYRESIDFLTHKTNRQGRLLAWIADELAIRGDVNKPLEVQIYQAIREHLEDEVKLIRERVSKREEDSD